MKNKKIFEKKRVTGFVLLTTMFLLGGCAKAEKGAGFQQISMEEAIAQMELETGYLILDVRTPEEYKQGHIPGAINIPNETIGTNEITQLPEKEQKIYVYCRSGNRSKQASRKLVKLGYSNIVEFGGIIDWTGEIE